MKKTACKRMQRFLLPLLLFSLSALMAVFVFLCVRREEGVVWFVMLLLCGGGLLLLMAAVIFCVYLLLTFGKQLASLAEEAKAFSRGEKHTPFSASGTAWDEIVLLTEALRDLSEQARFRERRIGNTQRELAVYHEIDGFFHTEEAFAALGDLAALLGRTFSLSKATIVRGEGGRVQVEAVYINSPSEGQTARTPPREFPHHRKIETMLAGKNLLFMNAYTLSQGDMNFLDSASQSCCVVSVTNGHILCGYIILESSEPKCFIDDFGESILKGLSAKLAYRWRREPLDRGSAVSEDGKKDGGQAAPHLPSAAAAKAAGIAPVTIHQLPRSQDDTVSGSHPPKTPAPPPYYASIQELDSTAALSAMGGLTEIYEQSLQLLSRLLPGAMDKLDRMIEDDFPNFTIEIHGLKGSLNNVGAYALGKMASELEALSGGGDSVGCRSKYPAFREKLSAFMESLTEHSPKAEPAEKPPGDKKALAELLRKSIAGAEEYDALTALAHVQAAQKYAYGEDIDGLLHEAVLSLETFDCEGALNHLGRVRL